MKLKLLAIIFALLLVFTGNLYAFSIDPSTASTSIIAGNDQLSDPYTVNSLAIFTFDDWVYIQKQNMDDGDLLTLETGINYGLIVDADVVAEDADEEPGHSGTWSFDPELWLDFSDVMIVLKAGNGFAAFLLNTDVSTGDWFSPDNALSHLTVYARGDAAPVPEPSTLLLLGAGIVGLAAYRRKKN